MFINDSLVREFVMDELMQDILVHSDPRIARERSILCFIGKLGYIVMGWF